MKLNQKGKSNLLTIALVIAAAIIATTLFVVILSDVYGSSVTVTNPHQQIDEQRGMLEDQSILHLNITYFNKTQALVNGEILNFELSDDIVRFINEKIQEEREGLTGESEEQPTSEESGSDSGSGGSGGDGGGSDGRGGNDSGGNDGNTGDEEPIDPFEGCSPEPQCRPPPKASEPEPPTPDPASIFIDKYCPEVNCTGFGNAT